MYISLTSWEEVGDGATSDNTKQQCHENICLDVCKGELEAVPERLSFAADPIVHTNILLKPPGGELALFFRKPLGGTREVGEDEESNEGNSDGDCAFEND
jgi:hypothetical protein